MLYVLCLAYHKSEFTLKLVFLERQRLFHRLHGEKCKLDCELSSLPACACVVCVWCGMWCVCTCGAVCVCVCVCVCSMHVVGVLFVHVCVHTYIQYIPGIIHERQVVFSQNVSLQRQWRILYT